MQSIAKRGTLKRCSGCQLPQKLDENERRREARRAAKQKGVELLAKGRKREAFSAFHQAVSITPAMKHDFIRELRARKIDFVVAPYEADAQLAYLVKTGVVDAVISEDSDLLLFGVTRMIAKLSKTGSGQMIDMALIESVPTRPETFASQLRHLTHEQFVDGRFASASTPGTELRFVLSLHYERV